MTLQLSSQLDRVFGPYAWLRFKRAFVGIFQDYWKDGGDLAAKMRREARKNALLQKKKGKSGDGKDKPGGLWHADRASILQRMWGDGFILPCGEAFTSVLMKPVGPTSQMSALDLSAGLGGLARSIATQFGTYVTGLEMDPDLARLGMMMSLAAGKVKQASVTCYDPTQFSTEKTYDAIVARELFYQLPKKGFFLKAVSEATKYRGHFAFTDYILDPAAKHHPAIVEWMQAEPNASPLSMPEMVGLLKTNAYDVRINEDQTDYYRHEIAEGLMRFADFLSENKPDPVAKELILREIDLWQKRVAAFENGLKFARFYAIKT